MFKFLSLMYRCLFVFKSFSDKRYYNDQNFLHREDGPAVEYTDGSTFWYLNGQYHRKGGPAVEYNDGSKQWWQYNHLHREDGPAYISSNGDTLWYLNGFLHREDGPAIERAYEKKWYYYGEKINCSSNDEFLKLIKLKVFW